MGQECRNVSRTLTFQSLGPVAESWRQLCRVQSGAWAATWLCTGGPTAHWRFEFRGAPLTTATWGVPNFIDKEETYFTKRGAFKSEPLCFEEQRVGEAGPRHVKRGFALLLRLLGAFREFHQGGPWSEWFLKDTTWCVGSGGIDRVLKGLPTLQPCRQEIRLTRGAAVEESRLSEWIC